MQFVFDFGYPFGIIDVFRKFVANIFFAVEHFIQPVFQPYAPVFQIFKAVIQSLHNAFVGIADFYVVSAVVFKKNVLFGRRHIRGNYNFKPAIIDGVFFGTFQNMPQYFAVKFFVENSLFFDKFGFSRLFADTFLFGFAGSRYLFFLFFIEYGVFIAVFYSFPLLGNKIRQYVKFPCQHISDFGGFYLQLLKFKQRIIHFHTFLTVDLSIDQKSDLETAAEAIEKFLSEQNESYTDEQKEELSGSINAIKSALESIARAEDAVSKIEAMPSAADAKPDDKTAIDAFEAAKAAYDALSDDEKRMAGEDAKTALEVMFKALTAYAVTDGNGSTWTESDNGGLTFTVNGYHEKFAGLVINGETVDKKYYDVKAGSTVITLKAEYLKTLTAGKYTILVQYADGSTDGEDAFTVKENGSVTPPDSASSSSQTSESNSSHTSESNSSQTTESNNLVVWVVIPIILIILLILLLLLLKNRKKNGKKN